jgi:hypothetical protein
MANSIRPLVFALAAGLAGSAAAVEAAPMKMVEGIRDARYCELLVVTGRVIDLKASVYNTLGLNDCPPAIWQAIDIDALKKQLDAREIIRNGPRHFLMDKIGEAGTPAPPVDFQGLELRLRATIALGIEDLLKPREPYAVRRIDRTTDYVFDAGQPVFELVDPKGQVYVMQAYSQIVDPSLSYNDLAGLGSRLKLPAGWQYKTRILDQDLVAQAVGQAEIVQDELQNTYQLTPQ